MSIKTLISRGICLVILSVGSIIVPVTALASEQVFHTTIRAQGISRNWAGYQTSGGRVTKVTGTWKVPKISENSSSGADAAWVGIGGVTSNDLIQAGTQGSVSRSGDTSYQAFYETLPEASQPLDVNVQAGDSITVTISEKSDGKWLIVFKNNTNGEHSEITQDYTSSRSSAEWIEEAPSGTRRIYPLDDFGSIQFIKNVAVIDGKSMSLAQIDSKKLDMINNFGTVLATSSDIDEEQSSFNVTRATGEESVPENQIPPFFNQGRHHFGRLPFWLRWR